IGAAKTAVVSILDASKATVSFKSAISSVGEGKTDAIVAVLTITGGGKLATDAKFNVATTLGTAEAADFTPVPTSITVAANSTNGVTQTINLVTATDALVEGNETLGVGLSVATGAATLGTQKVHGVTILDANTANVTFQAANSTVAEGATDSII